VNTGLILFAHGSRVHSANDSVRAVARTVARSGNFERVECAFLELARPDLGEAVSHLAGRGCARILVVPYFLTLGLHLHRDLPVLVENIAQTHPGVEIRVSRPLDDHNSMARVVLERARDTLSHWQ
jgi:sirohydrochlorin cobaltochelatase